jgi:signal transduction histidine kinase
MGRISSGVSILKKESVQSATPLEKPPALDVEQQPFSRPEIRIAIIYVLLGTIWIIGSDTVLEKVCGSDGMIWFLQSTKGLNFVVTTGVVIYLVLRRAYGGWRSSELRRLEEARAASEGYRRLSARIQHLREEERTRISREIHDELGQLLTGIKMQLRLIENRIADRDDRGLNPLIDEMVEAEETVDETLRSVRRISKGLRPMALDDLGLASALQDEAAEFSRRTGIKCDITTTETDERLPSEMETAVFRIFQETLTNIARHAEASKVEAECVIKDHCIVLRIQDDGVGIDPSRLCNRESLGLKGMRERAAGVGGCVTFKSLPEHGTEVVLTINLPVCEDF